MSQTLIVCHDAGGAEVISSWVKHQTGKSFCYLLEGPAVAVFRHKCGELDLLSRGEALAGLSTYDRVLTGTSDSLISELEMQVIVVARRAGIPVCTFLDHWVNYPARFILEGKQVLPDQIWAGDAEAYRIACEVFPAEKVRLEPNLYFEDLAREVAALRPEKIGESGEPRVLYVCEPIAAEAFGYTDLEALENYLKFLAGGRTKVAAVRVRKHPSETAEKYAAVVKAFSSQLSVSVGAGTSLVEDLAWSDWVVGCDTAALVAGIFAKRKVFSCIPAGGKPMTLPFSQIIKLF